jgi:hypothetical protein
MIQSFNGVRQIGYVVSDIEKSMRHWIKNLGVGPWFYRKEMTPLEFRYYGKSLEKPKFSIALAQAGEVQIELIQSHNDAPSLYRDTLEKNGEGAQHVAFWTMNDFDKWCQCLLDLGYIEGHGGRMDSVRGRFAYFVHPELPSGMFEISESTGGKAEHFEKIKRAALGWDGSDPIRV